MMVVRKISNTLESYLTEGKESINEVCTFFRNQMQLNNDVDSDDEMDTIPRKISTSMDRRISPGTFSY